MKETDLQHLFSLRNEYRSLRYDVRNTEILCEALGNPQDDFRSVLIAGTNGKGSVARWLSAMLPDAGLYTSPHLRRLNERISIGGDEIDDEALEVALDTVRKAAFDVAGDLLYPPTYFELVTLAAYCYFSGRVRHAILEVGLGGRLDSTNVVSQDVSVITNIGYDHQEHLGPTLEDIAEEKAGIIKDSEPVVLGVGCGFESILTRARGRQIDAGQLPLRAESRGWGLFSVDLLTPVRRYPDLKPRFPGRHQIDNLKVAVRTAECLEELRWPLDARRIARGIDAAIWPGRLERFPARPVFLVDGGHNVSAAAALARYLGEFHPGGMWLIFGGMREKNLVSMLNILAPHARRLVLTRVADSRSADPRELAAQFPEAVVSEGIEDAISYVRSQSSGEEVVLITGSLYLVGEARIALERLSAPLHHDAHRLQR